MPNPQRHVRLSDDEIEAGRTVLGVSDDVPVAQLLRAAFLRLIGRADATGEPASRGGRPRRQPAEAGQ